MIIDCRWDIISVDQSMAEDDWDLHAVVRSCKSAATKNSIATNNSIAASSEDSLACLASLTFEEENDLLSFPLLAEPRTNAFHELQELCKSFFPTTTTSTATTTSSHRIISPNSSSISDVQRRRHPVQPNPTISAARSRSKPEPSASSSSGLGGVQDQQLRRHAQQQPQQQNQPYQQRQQVNQQEFQRPRASSAMSLSAAMQSQAPRSRKRCCLTFPLICFRVLTIPKEKKNGVFVHDIYYYVWR